jgi:hypothetical protein
VVLAWSDVPESYADGSVATGMTSRARQVKGDDPDKKGYPGPPGWWLVTNPPHKKYSLEKLLKKEEAEVHQGL